MTYPDDGSLPGLVAPEDEDTIELELTAEQMRALSRAAIAPQSKHPSPPLANDSSPIASPQGKPRGRVPLLVGIALAMGLGGCFAYMAMTRETHIDIAQIHADVPEEMTPTPSASEELPSVSPLVETKPVKFRNPFDAKEVFEFPPGTSQAEARDAVAELLMQRALDRQHTSAGKSQRGGKTAQR